MNHLTGLTAQQVEESRQRYGTNVLTPAAKKSMFRKFLEKFSDPLIRILMVAGLLSIAISCYEYWSLDKGGDVFFEPVGIFMAILLATGMSFLFEAKADKAFSILNKVNDDEPVKVLRDTNTVLVPKRDIVVGDIVYINTGDEIPADGQLLEAVTLSIDESSLTGEPVCEKSTDPAHFDKEATYPTDWVLRGSKVMEGHGIFKVERVGDATENGKVFTEAQITDNVRTPLDEQFDRLGKKITIMSYIVAALIFIGRIIMYFSELQGGVDWIDFTTYLLQTAMIAVALIVVSVPEGLPMAVTLSLAYSMRRMLKTNNLVRKMHACETMGATTVICTDKTGTLTQNQMQIYDTDFLTLPDQKLTDSTLSKIIVEGIAVNSTASLDLSGEKPSPLGNPTEGALLLWLNAKGYDYTKLKADAPRLAELPFTTERKYMASIVESAVTGRPTLYVKGAPEIVLGLCSNILGDTPREAIQQKLLSYQSQGMRTLAFAFQELDNIDGVIADNRVNANDLTFLGIVAISDPVRADVPDAVKECIDAGIAIKIVTGDTPATAREIGRQIGLWNSDDTDRNIITGPEVAALSDDELTERIPDFKIIARARPTDKKRLVEALQRRNQVVAVTGDGTNDAPALNAANVGLSMGDGTSVAKEASDITIIDNSFTSIGRAVMWGRSLYRNIQRFILFQLTVNFVACVIVLAGAFMGTTSPLTVTQMLWVNLIMDTLAAVALASLPPTRSVMQDKPRPRTAFIINPAMWKNIIVTGVIFFVALFGLLYVFNHADVHSLTNLFSIKLGESKGMSDYELSLFFSFFVFLQFWNLFNARAFQSGRSAFALKGCGEFELIAFIVAIGQIMIVTIGGEFFSVVPLRLVDWIIIISSTSMVLWIGELVRLLDRSHHAKD